MFISCLFLTFHSFAPLVYSFSSSFQMQPLSAVSHSEALVNRPKVTEVHFQHRQTLPSFPRGWKHPCRCQRAGPQFIHLCFEDLLSHSGPLSKTCDLYHHDSGYNLNRGLAGSIWRESELTESADRIHARWANLSLVFPEAVTSQTDTTRPALHRDNRND